MFKKNILIVFLFIISICKGQELVSSLDLKFKRDKNIFQIVSDSTSALTLFFSSKSDIKTITLDGNFQIKDSLSTKRPDDKFKEIIGYTSYKTTHNVFWSNYKNTELYVQIFNYQNKTVTNNIFLLEFDKETIIQKFSYKNKFYIVSTLKNSNDLRFHVFDSQNNLTKKIVTITGDFYIQNHTKTDLYGVFKLNMLPFEEPFSVTKISTESPTALSKSSKKRKCYLNNDDFIITFDNNTTYTHKINIDLETFTSATKTFKKDELDSFSAPNSNSFLYENKIYQLKSNADKVIFTIKDLNDNLLKKHTITRNDSITFKNSEIIQLGGFGIPRKILTKNSQFIRKNYFLSPSISCYSLNDQDMITIGCVSQEAKANYGSIGIAFGLAGVFVALAVNSIYESFNEYADRKVVYFNSLFGLNSEHIDGKIGDLAFDKIKEFQDNNKSEDEFNIIKLKDFYYLCSHNVKEKKYIIRKFQD